MPIDQEAASKWATRSEQSRSERIQGFCLFIWHQKLPQIFGGPFTIGGFLAGILHLVSIIVIASSQFWSDYFGNGQFDIYEIIKFTLVVVVFMVYIWLYDQLSRKRRLNRRQRESEQMLALRQTEAIEQMSRFIKTEDNVHSAEKDKIICALLNCIDRHTQAFLKGNNEQYFQATLMAFNKDQETVFLGWRAHSTRTIGKSVPSVKTAAYYVAKARQSSKTIHDLKTSEVFEFEGLSVSGPPPYRSILLIPVTKDHICKGVISIDASAPYEFWGARENDLIVEIMPYVRLISLFLDDDKYGLVLH